MQRRGATLEFMQACRAAKSAADIAARLFEEMERCGIAYVACASHVDPLRPPRGAVAMVNYPIAWLNRFSEQRYAARDPMFFGARASPYSFWWNEYVETQKLAPDQKRILEEASECGIKNGLTIPIYSPGALPASCSLVPGSDGIDPLILPDLEYMARYAHEEARRRSGGAVYEPVRLTPREHEVMSLVGRGKSDPIIGEILGVSARTAHEHVENAKRRYGVTHRVQAVVLALFDGNISPSDLID